MAHGAKVPLKRTELETFTSFHPAAVSLSLSLSRLILESDACLACVGSGCSIIGLFFFKKKKNTGLGYSAQARLAHLHEVMIVILGNETNSTFVN